MSNMQENHRKPNTESMPCRLFEQGLHCNCKFRHEPPARVNGGRFNSSSSSSDSKPSVEAQRQPCRQWRRGQCPRGDSCGFLHETEGGANRRGRAKGRNDTPTQRGTEEQARQAAGDTQRAQEEKEMEELRRRELERQEQEAQAERLRIQGQVQQGAEREATESLKHVALGTTIVTFFAGLAIGEVVTGFESCRVWVKGLPLDAKPHEVSDLFVSQGLQTGQFHLVALKKRPGNDPVKQEAEVIIESEFGTAFAVGLDGIDFRGESLSFEVSEASTEGMGASSGQQSRILYISWRAPCVRYVATFSDMAQTEAKIQELFAQRCSGRVVRVEKNVCPPGRAAFYFNPHSIVISNLPLNITDRDVATFAGTPMARVRRLPKPISYDVDQSILSLREHIQHHANGEFPRIEITSREGSDGRVSARAQFNSWENANRVRDSLANPRRHAWIGDSSFFLRLPDPHFYTIRILRDQYTAQKRQWDYLVETSGGKEQKSCSVRVMENPGHERVQIRVLGDDKKAVGSLKVRVETLVAGKRLEGWHRSLDSPRGRQFLGKVSRSTGAFARIDWRVQAIKVYGEVDAVDRARTMIDKEIERLSSQELTVKLKRQSIRFFVQNGVAVLKEAFGDDSVTLNIASSPCEITVRGGEDVRHTLNRLIEDSLDKLKSGTVHEGGEVICPVCYDEVSSPEHLACGHSYCSSCLQHYLTGADGAAIPLVCAGNEAQCKVPIPIAVIRRFLTPRQMNQLLEMAFVTYVEQRPQEFKYCKTPDCGQIYRSSTTTARVASFLHCPSCFSSVCPGCDGEAHEGMSCEEWRLQSNHRAEQEEINAEWARRNGVKKCPSCDVWMEKIEGCNHMTCKCGAHVCWQCMSAFTAHTIYGHLREAHGGIYGEDPHINNAAVEEEMLADFHREHELRLRELQRERDEEATRAARERLEALRREREAEACRAEVRRQEEARILLRRREEERGAEMLRLKEEEAEARRREEEQRAEMLRRQEAEARRREEEQRVEMLRRQRRADMLRRWEAEEIRRRNKEESCGCCIVM